MEPKLRPSCHRCGAAVDVSRGAPCPSCGELRLWSAWGYWRRTVLAMTWKPRSPRNVLVEGLLVAAIVGVLIALMLPSVTSTNHNARRRNRATNPPGPVQQAPESPASTAEDAGSPAEAEILEAARRAVATNDTWVDHAEFDVPRRDGSGWNVTVWRLPKTPGGHRLIKLDAAGVVTEYWRGR